MPVIGVDMGGTNIRASIVTEKGEILDEVRLKTGISGHSILLQIIESIELLLARSSMTIDAAGVGASGMIHPQTGEIVGAGDTIPGWLGIKLKKHLTEQLPIPLFVGNDVNAAALGEGWINGREDFVFVSIGTGLGGAIIHRGQIFTGVNGGTGEFGHTILHPGGIPCGCGKKGCAEKYVSGTAVGARAKGIDPGWDSFRLIEEVSRKDERAIKVAKQFAADLSLVLVNIQTMIDPPAIVLGGGFTDTYAAWEDFLAEALEQTGNKRKMNLHISKSGNETGMLGAARLALNEIGKGII